MMKKYTAYITIQGKTEAKRLKISIEADSDSEATQKAWQRVSIEIKPDDVIDNVEKMFNDMFGGFK